MPSLRPAYVKYLPTISVVYSSPFVVNTRDGVRLHVEDNILDIRNLYEILTISVTFTFAKNVRCIK